MFMDFQGVSGALFPLGKQADQVGALAGGDTTNARRLNSSIMSKPYQRVPSLFGRSTGTAEERFSRYTWRYKSPVDCPVE